MGDEQRIALDPFHIQCHNVIMQCRLLFPVQLMVYDVNMRRVDAIPTIQGSRAAGIEGQNGIHAIQINPSRTLLATGARHSSDIAVYRLPTLDPLCIGENSHRDWVNYVYYMYTFIHSVCTDNYKMITSIDSVYVKTGDGYVLVR